MWKAASHDGALGSGLDPEVTGHNSWSHPRRPSSLVSLPAVTAVYGGRGPSGASTPLLEAVCALCLLRSPCPGFRLRLRPSAQPTVHLPGCFPGARDRPSPHLSFSFCKMWRTQRPSGVAGSHKAGCHQVFSAAVTCGSCRILGTRKPFLTTSTVWSFAVH